MTQSYRPEVRIDADKLDAFDAAIVGRYVRADLVHQCLGTAYRAARMGLRLPPAMDRRRRETERPRAEVRWTCPRAEVEQVHSELARAGSSARAVIETNIDMFLAAGAGLWAEVPLVGSAAYYQAQARAS